MVVTRMFAVAVLSVALPAQQEGVLRKFEFHGQTLGGQEIDQDDFAKNVLILDLWGTWCPPCREAVPVLAELYQKYKHHGLEIVGYCYTSSGVTEDPDVVRKFAVENGITWSLLPGDAAVRRQVEDFKGYPTMLLFGRGLTLEHTHVGWTEDSAAEVEKWVRKALGLEAAAPEAEAEPKEQVPAGKIFEPGNGDTGFEIEAVGVNGEDFSFAALRSAPVLLAMTSSWDQTAGATAAFLQGMLGEFPGLHVAGWYVEMTSDPEQRQATVREFLAARGASYRAFATPLALTRAKVHRYASVPTLLLFSADGVLIQRENGISGDIESRLRARVRELLASDKR